MSMLCTDIVDHVVMGTVIQESRTSNIAREVCCSLGDDVLLSFVLLGIAECWLS